MEREATVVGTTASSVDPYGGHPSRLVDGKGLNGVWVYESVGPTVCAQDVGQDPKWFSLELEVPHIVTKVQLAKRMESRTEAQGRCVTISVGSSAQYDPNEALCRPQIAELQHTSGLVDYPCTSNQETGRFVKISKSGCADNLGTILF